jgi:hypothetical protein
LTRIASSCQFRRDASSEGLADADADVATPFASPAGAVAELAVCSFPELDELAVERHPTDVEAQMTTTATPRPGRPDAPMRLNAVFLRGSSIDATPTSG